MNKGERLDALRRAKWRKDHQGSRCRLCGGSTFERRPYCRGHFRWLLPHKALAQAAAAGERLDECDALITLRGRIKVSIDMPGTWMLTNGMMIRRVGREGGTGGYELRDIHDQVVAEFRSVLDVVRHLTRNVGPRSSHNNFARKTLIL